MSVLHKKLMFSFMFSIDPPWNSFRKISLQWPELSQMCETINQNHKWRHDNIDQVGGNK